MSSTISRNHTGRDGTDAIVDQLKARFADVIDAATWVHTKIVEYEGADSSAALDSALDLAEAAMDLYEVAEKAWGRS